MGGEIAQRPAAGSRQCGTQRGFLGEITWWCFCLT